MPLREAIRLKSLFWIEHPAARRIVNIFLVVFYLFSVVLWFKDSFSFLRAIPLSPLVGIIPLILLAILRILLRAAGNGTRPALLDRRDTTALFLILAVVILVRIPFLTHAFGLMNSDEAVPALMGKHIAEGGRPPLYFYGQFYLGSLPQHFYALLFGLFGYSVFLAKLSAFLAYLAFICVHYVLLKKMFCFLPAVAASAFFVLPLPHLVRAGFDLGSGYPFVLLFGGLIFLLTHAVVFEKDDRPIPLLGFFMGLAFWTHQISFVFLATAALFLAPALKLRWKKYAAGVFSFALGAFPLILNEIYRKFLLVKFLYPEGGAQADPLPLGHYKDLVLSLIVLENGPAAGVVLFLILAGTAGPVFLSLKNKNLHPSFLFVAFALLFSIVYLFSDFGRTGVIRYLYVLYPVFPVLFAGALLPLGKRIAAPALAVFFLFLLFVGNWAGSREFLSTTREKHRLFSRTVAAMEETGEKHWMAEYWTSYLLTALSGERLVVASTTINRYFPYKLLYDSGENSNVVINRDNPHSLLAEVQAANLADLLDSLGVSYEFREVGTMALFHGIGSNLYPRFPLAVPQKTRPDIRLEKAHVSDGLLELLFIRTNEAPTGGYRIHIEIPGYFSRFFPLPDENRFTRAIPYPDQREFSIRHHLAYAGLNIPGTAGETSCVLSEEDLRQSRNPVVFLAGVGPRMDIEERRMYALRKKAAFEIQAGTGPATQLAVYLFSPFFFNHPYWYGDYRQDVTVSVNGVPFVTERLHDGDNVLRFDIGRPPFGPGRNRIEFSFRHAMVLSVSHLWKTAAYLENMAFERPPEPPGNSSGSLGNIP